MNSYIRGSGPLKTLIHLNKRQLEGVYDFDICTIHPVYCDIGGKGNTSTVAELTFKGNIKHTDGDLLVNKYLNWLLISLLSVIWRSNISDNIERIYETELKYQQYRYPDKPIKEIGYNTIYNRPEDSWWNTWFTYSPSFQEQDRTRFDFEKQYFMLASDFNVPSDTNSLINKFLMISVDRQIAFHRACECYKLALDNFERNNYMAATYLAISIESLAKYEYKFNNPKNLKKSSDYYKEFFRDYFVVSEELEKFLGIIYKFRNDHVHEGFFPNELWETNEPLNSMTIYNIESLVNHCLIRWLINQEIVIKEFLND